ncbi:uncharacterized protein LOC100900790 [Galendromus occidentalis]|uniref:Uncharacterized protein LOC100900790 n=1 Tax=Galendromus occidentalis TaxID=34638 RepID=A0AAJ6VZL4_9ACAR|nr:uncharacterized protein LOC100900790 [Galendromus occidentalis]
MMLKLLPEMLQESILLKLNPIDRLACASACSHLADLLTTPTLLKDFWFTIRGSDAAAASDMLRSRRRYWRLHIQDARLSLFNDVFWSKVGEDIRELRITSCRWSSEVFYNILRQCRKLESLEFEGEWWSESEPALLPPDETFREPILCLRHLHLRIECTREALAQFLGLIPNLTSFFLSSFPTVPDELAFDINSLLGTKRKLTRFGIRQVDINDASMVQILAKYSETLEDLRIPCGSQITQKTLDAISKCKRLRQLSLERIREEVVEDRHLEKILLECHDLEILNVYFGDFPRTGYLRYIDRPKKLRKLCLGDRMSFGWLDVLQRTSALQELELNMADDTIEDYRKIARLTELRCLTLLGKGPSPECFGCLVENLKNLRDFRLHCTNLTDTDGIKFRLLKNLRKLSIVGAAQITDRTFELGLGSPSLEKLVIVESPLTDDGLVGIAMYHARLIEFCLVLIKDMEHEIRWPFPDEDELVREHLVLMQQQQQLFIPVMQEQLLFLQQAQRQDLDRFRALIQQQQLQLEQYRKRFILYMDYAQQRGRKEERTIALVEHHFSVVDQLQKRLSYEMEYQQTLQQQLNSQQSTSSARDGSDFERDYSVIRDQLFILEQYQLRLFGMMEQEGQERQIQKQLLLLQEHGHVQQQQNEFVPLLHEQLLLLQRQRSVLGRQPQQAHERDRVLSVVKQQLLILRQYQERLFSIVDKTSELLLLEKHQQQIIAIMQEHLLLLQRQQHRQQPQEQERIYSVLQQQLLTLKQCQEKLFSSP